MLDCDFTHFVCLDSHQLSHNIYIWELTKIRIEA